MLHYLVYVEYFSEKYSMQHKEFVASTEVIRIALDKK